MSEKNLAVTDYAPVSLEHLVNQIATIQEAMSKVMKIGVHHGTVPGCGDKPALFKAGAEKLCMIFRLVPSFERLERDLSNGHREYIITCRLTDARGNIAGEGLGSCSTLESKYRYRNGSRKCPKCGAEQIRRSKEEYGGGYYCHAKAGGCGAKFDKGDPSIEQQIVGKIDNPDIADQYNTVLKMAKKRAHVDATITATAASDIFTQDIEERIADVEYVEAVPAEPKAPKESYYYNTALIEEMDKRTELEAWFRSQNCEEIGKWIFKYDKDSKKLAHIKVAKPLTEPVMSTSSDFTIADDLPGDYAQNPDPIVVSPAKKEDHIARVKARLEKQQGRAA